MSGALDAETTKGLTHALRRFPLVLMQHLQVGTGERNPNELPDAPHRQLNPSPETELE
jgi:hypothetical protein